MAKISQQYGISKTVRYLGLGVLCGALFPVLAAVLDAYQMNATVWDSYFDRRNILRLIIDSAPFVLGILSAVVGRKQDKLEAAQKLLNQDLAQSQRFLETLVENLPVALLCKDYENETGKIIQWNRGAEEIWGYSSKDAIGKSTQELFSEKDEATSGPTDKDILERNCLFHIPREKVFSENKNKYITLETWKIPLPDSNGKLRFLLSISLDITKNVLAADQLAETRNLLEQQRLALDASAIVTIADPDGNIMYANKKFSETSGYSAEESSGKNHRIVASHYHEPKFYEELWRTISSGAVWHGEIRNRNKSGNFYWVDSTIVPIKDVNGKITQYVSIHYDITQRKIAQHEAEVAKEKALAASRTKAIFLANMSHEIRTPMNGILGMCNLMSESIKDPKELERLTIIKDCGKFLLNLIGDILDFSKLEAGKIELESSPFSIIDSTHAVIQLLESTAREKGLEIVFCAGPDAPPFIIGDETRFKQILSNLVGNAIKFSQKGKIDIKYESNRLGENSEIRFTVSDNGIGIADELKEKLFVAFSQVDASTTRKFGGTGLGLAICKGLCEQMGGTISVDSRLGEGSQFRFSFLAKVADKILPVRLPRNPSLNKEMANEIPLSILIAEDNRVNQLVLSSLLQQLGYSPDLVEDGEQAIEATKNKTYDLILMDCHMPRLDGFKASKAIKKKNGAQVIFAVTASTDQESKEACALAGMDKVIEKPIVISAIAKAIESQFSSNMKVDEIGFNFENVISRYGEIADSALTIFGAFLENAPNMLEKIRSAIQENNPRGLELSAHALRGSLSYLHYTPATESAKMLESLGANRNLEQAPQEFEKLNRYVAVVLGEISNKLGKGKAS